jgi:hypothetical protein
MLTMETCLTRALATLALLAGCADRPLYLPTPPVAPDVRDLAVGPRDLAVGPRDLTVAARDLADASSCASNDGKVHLLEPMPDAPIPQNVSDLPCSAASTGGRGYRAVFSWCPVAGATSYRLLVKAPNGNTNLDQIVTGNSYTDLQCEAFVADMNLKGWTWSVSVEGGPSASGTFQFAPCRLDDGSACFSF